MSNNKYVPLLFHRVDFLVLHTRLMDIACSILFILGVIGNILGLFIFSLSRRTWRISSIYGCLATCSSIINLLCVIRYAAILHSTSRNTIQQLVGQTWWACKFYEFSASFRIISSWIALFWMFERLTCASRRLRTITNLCNLFNLKFIIPIIIILTILGCVIGPPVYMFQPKIIILNNDTINSITSTMYCALDSNASIKWQRYFHELHFGMNHFTIRCLLSDVIPAVLFNFYIIHYICRVCRCLHRASDYKRRKGQSRTTSWMNIVLFLHSLLFLASFLAHIIGHFISVEVHETWWILLVILINYSINFYIYCLSGEVFRNEIHRFIYRFKMQITYNMQICHSQHRRLTKRHSFTYEMNNFGYILQHRNTLTNHILYHQNSKMVIS